MNNLNLKSMKKQITLLSALLLISFFSIASVSVIDGLAGSWIFNVEQTLPEYSKGKIVIEEGDEEYTGQIVLDSGRTISISSIEVEADTVTFKAYVDGGLVTTICTLEGDQLNGSVRTPDGFLPFSATREE